MTLIISAINLTKYTIRRIHFSQRKYILRKNIPTIIEKRKIRFFLKKKKTFLIYLFLLFTIHEIHIFNHSNDDEMSHFEKNWQKKFEDEIRRRISSLLRFLGLRDPRILINFPKTNLPRGSREISVAPSRRKLFPRARVFEA